MNIKKHLIFSIIFSGLSSFSVWAAMVNVTTLLDEFSDVNPITGCSLREAIETINTNTAFGGCTFADTTPAPHTIMMPAGTFQLTIDGRNEDNNTTGDLDIKSGISLNIDGAGPDATIIDANKLDRVFDLVEAGGKMVIANLMITNGFTTGGGGAIFNNGNNLTLENVYLIRNEINHESSADECDVNSKGRGGGAIEQQQGELKITDSLVDNNKHSSCSTFNGGVRGTPGWGGGIAVENAIVTIIDSMVSNNAATGACCMGSTLGGGIAIESSSMTFQNSTLTNNTLGGTSPIKLGSGIYGGIVEFNESTVSNDSIHQSTLTLLNSTMIDGNINGTSILINSTLSNSSVEAPSVSIINSTVTGQEAFIQASTISMINSIISNQSGDSCRFFNDVSGANNLVNDDSCSPIAATSDALINLDTQLANNGGPTKTYALLPGSVAIDAATNTACLAELVNGRDQRGLMRGIDGNAIPNDPKIGDCDIGAFEWYPEDIFENGFEANTSF